MAFAKKKATSDQQWCNMVEKEQRSVKDWEDTYGSLRQPTPTTTTTFMQCLPESAALCDLPLIPS